MKRVLIVVALIVCAAVLGLWRSHGGVRAGFNRVVNAAGDNNSAGVTADETRKTFDLKPGTHVNIQGINGRVEIQTSDTNTAEVVVKRTGDNPASLRRREMIIEQTSDGLLVRSKQNHVGLWDHLFGSDPKEEVTIKAPRQIALSFKGINGRVYSSDIDGSLEVKGINGRVELGQVNDSVEVDGINGSIAVGLNKLSERGVHIHGVNGGIELKLSSGLNADLTAKGMNGSVRSEIAEVTVEKDDRWSHYQAHIGGGGPAIELSGINGNVRLTRAESASAAPAPSDKSNNANTSAKSRNVQ
ncbi:MAG TPA: hypothetical protein VK557_16060 [Pyrinomonadaceae bacterium]|nr:hypothetical protein [Pyrinomonadaceae bacterium]